MLFPHEVYLLPHRALWDAIDALADRHQISVSKLARLAGLDATAFNRSKRVSKDGRPRWPSSESLTKILEATNESPSDFLAGGGWFGAKQGGHGQPSIPLLGLAEAGAGGYFDAAGFPAGRGWEEVGFPGANEGNTYALEVSGDSMLPAYRNGDRLIVAPNEQLRRGDRVVVRTLGGEVTAKVLHRQTATSVELHSLNPEYEPRTVQTSEIDWMARILWASQ